MRAKIHLTGKHEITLALPDGSKRVFFLDVWGQIKEKVEGMPGGINVCRKLKRTGDILTAIDAQTALAVIREEHARARRTKT